jgi:DUF1680 family protein
MKRMMIGVVIWLGAGVCVSAEFLEMMPPEQVSIRGYLGERMDGCYEKCVKGRDPNLLIEPFKSQTQTDGWQTEFWGKWMLAAAPDARYYHDEAMKARIAAAVNGLLATQNADGYIGNYTKEARTSGPWDIWGRKYTLLGLLAYFDMSGDTTALEAARRVADHLMTEVGPGRKDLYRVGAYHGMASTSVLEPMVLLYRRTQDKRYLEFAHYILSQWKAPEGADLIGKALAGVSVGDRFEHPGSWWTFENGMKAYEMMSCYQGLTELYRLEPEAEYLTACRMTADDIAATEINIAGSGSAYECWYHGRARQQIPAYHTMETCVTTTWIKYCQTLLSLTGEPKYADRLEEAVYNALLGALKPDGSTFAKYTPLEGIRCRGEDQCGMPINCCIANGPRGFAAAAESIVMRGEEGLFVNLYAESTVETVLPGGAGKVTLAQQTSYPESGAVVLTIHPERESEFTLNLRIPAWSRQTAVKVNGQPQGNIHAGTYYAIRRAWKAGDKIEAEFDFRCRVIAENHHLALMRGPIVFARDSRFNDGNVDRAGDFAGVKDGTLTVRAAASKPEGVWMAVSAEMVFGTSQEGEGGRAVTVQFCDFASAGGTWDLASYYRVWIRQVLNAVRSPYRASEQGR